MYERIMVSTKIFRNKHTGIKTPGFDVMSADMRTVLDTVETMQEATDILKQEKLACSTGGCED